MMFTQVYFCCHSIGSILCSIQYPVKVATKFEARVIIFNIEIPITVGYPVGDVFMGGLEIELYIPGYSALSVTK